LDLLTEEEQKIDEETMELRFNIPLLSNRSIMVTKWVLKQPEFENLPIGLFGASTGAAAALTAAAMLRNKIAAVVSRGGRPDMAESALERVQAPTLLVVGGNDEVVLGLNRDAFRRMHCTRRLHIVSGATHLFEEKGALEEVTRIAGGWFLEHILATAEKTLGAQAG
jgi:pimeloyl-ACP methyl ester carboxylesterase